MSDQSGVSSFQLNLNVYATFLTSDEIVEFPTQHSSHSRPMHTMTASEQNRFNPLGLIHTSLGVSPDSDNMQIICLSVCLMDHFPCVMLLWPQDILNEVSQNIIDLVNFPFAPFRNPISFA